MTRILRLGDLWLNCCIVIQFNFFVKVKYENKINLQMNFCTNIPKMWERGGEEEEEEKKM